MTDYQSLEGAPLVAKNDYTAYVEYVENVLGGRREQITLDENYTKIVTLTDAVAASTGPVVDIRCPAGQKISIMGTQQIPRGADARSAHSLRVRCANSSDAEIGFGNKMRLTKEGITDSITNLARVFYGDISLVKTPGTLATATTIMKTDGEYYRWKQGVELNGEQHLILGVINLNAGDLIDDDHVRFAAELDIWYF